MIIVRSIVAAGMAILFLSLGSAPAAQGGYDWPQAAQESYWYAYYNLRALISSGLGMVREEAEALRELAAKAGLTEVISLPYKSGDPTYAQTGSLKWSEAKMEKVITTEGLAWFIISASSQAKQLEQLYRRGIVRDGAAEATLLGHLASEAARFAYEALRDPGSGLYGRSWSEEALVPEPKARDQFAMLWALSELVTLARSSLLYRGEVSQLEAEFWAEELFRAISLNLGEEGMDPHEIGLVIEALASYAATQSGPKLEEVLGLIEAELEELAGLLEGGGSASELAAGVCALITVYQLTGDIALKTAALKIWEKLQGLWDEEAGVYAPAEGSTVYEYTLWDLGAIVGAFGAVIDGAGLNEMRARYARFFDSAVKRSRLMIAEGPEAGGGLDGDAVPAPEGAGGPFGRAPVFQSRLQYDIRAREWYIINSRFQTAGALQLAARLTWIGRRDGHHYLGPPAFGLPTSQEAQLISIRRRLEELRQPQGGITPEEFEGLKQLLTLLEDRLERLKEENAAVLSGLEGELSRLEQRLAALEEHAQAEPQPEAKERAVTFDETVTVILIIFVLMVGFVAYQWVMRRFA